MFDTLILEALVSRHGMYRVAAGHLCQLQDFLTPYASDSALQPRMLVCYVMQSVLFLHYVMQSVFFLHYVMQSVFFF